MIFAVTWSRRMCACAGEAVLNAQALTQPEFETQRVQAHERATAAKKVSA